MAGYHIVVCLKMVSQASYADLYASDQAGERLSSGSLVLNPADACALEYALSIKDKYPDTSVTVLTMSPMTAVQLLTDAMALGADSAYLITGKEYAGSDTVATSETLSKAIKYVDQPDFIFCGSKAIDSETGHIGPQLAELLGWKLLSGVIDVQCNNGKPYVIQSWERQLFQKQLLPGTVVTVINRAMFLRKPTILGLRRARQNRIAVLDSSIILPSASHTETIEIQEVPFAHRRGKKETDISQGIEDIYERIVGCHQS